MTRNFKLITTVISVLIFTLGLAVYFNVLNGEFQFDDIVFIVNQPAIRDITNLNAIWYTLAHPSRFITFLTFALNYHYHGLDVFGYHMVNNIIHACNGVLVFWFITLLFETQRIKDKYSSFYQIFTACAVALTFVTHPLQTQAVSYITQRFTSLAALFYLVALVLYLVGRVTVRSDLSKRVYLGLAIVVGLVGMFSKQTVFTLPIVVILIEVILFNHNKYKWAKSGYFWTIIASLFVIPSFFKFSIKNVLLNEIVSGSHFGETTNSWHYFLTQTRVVVRYLELVFYPKGQTLYYDFAASRSILELKTALCFLFLCALFGIGIWLLRKRPLVGFGIIWFFVTLSVTSTIIPIHHAIFEHRMYVALIGIALSVFLLLQELTSRRKVLVGILIGVVVILSTLTVLRNNVWKTNVSMWEDVVRKHPNQPRSYNNLGFSYTSKNNTELALDAFAKALKLAPGYAEVYNNRGVLYMRMGKYQEALKEFQLAIDYGISRPELYDNVGLIYYKTHAPQLAITYFTKAIVLNEQYDKAYGNRGTVYQFLKQYDLSIKDLTMAININKLNPAYFYNRGTTLGLMEEYQKSLKDFNHAIELSPNLVQAYVNRGMVYFKQNIYTMAEKDFNQALTLNPRHTQAYLNQANLYLHLKQYDVAVQLLKQAYQLLPRDLSIKKALIQAYQIRSSVYKKQGLLDKASKDTQSEQELNHISQ
ncbi:MAG: tetratricopeptide (TPR) repeat protein [Candidatus Omnitrophota bacterium]|jgi:tetratricopeptide (TPR) repeat protein